MKIEFFFLIICKYNKFIKYEYRCWEVDLLILMKRFELFLYNLILICIVYCVENDEYLE